MQRINKLLEALSEREGLRSQRDIAKRINIDHSTISRWDSRQSIKPSTIAKIARAIAVSATDLSLYIDGNIDIQTLLERRSHSTKLERLLNELTELSKEELQCIHRRSRELLQSNKSSVQELISQNWRKLIVHSSITGDRLQELRKGFQPTDEELSQIRAIIG